MTRLERLMPGGIPRYIRYYDNGAETFDRYTIVFTRLGNKAPNGLYLGCSTLRNIILSP